MGKEVIVNYIKELEIQKLFYEKYKDFMPNSELWIEWYDKQIRRFKKKLEEVK